LGNGKNKGGVQTFSLPTLALVVVVAHQIVLGLGILISSQHHELLMCDMICWPLGCMNGGGGIILLPMSGKQALADGSNRGM